ncbi:MAG: magnesium-translocating P-type ATPase [Chloroflexales bacterium]
MDQPLPTFWSLPAAQVIEQLGSTPQGLASAQAQLFRERYGPNALRPARSLSGLRLLLKQFESPITLILIGAAILSLFLGDSTNAIIILGIVLISSVLGFWQERGAADALAKLLAVVQTKVTVLRDGGEANVAIADVVPGDLVLLAAGATISADCLLLESLDLFVDEAALTGETYPVEKSSGVLPADTALGQRTNVLFMGTHVVSGSARALVVHTGLATEFGGVSERLGLQPPETEFERGIRRFGYFLMEVTLVLIVLIFAVNVYLARPVLDSFLFSLALAVGLTPQLLPAIISINLAQGAKQMARQKVIVKRLAAIENFGSMNVLCSDKTGTLTEGQVHVESLLDVSGSPSDTIALYAYLNATYETGYLNPIDEAIRNDRRFDLAAYRKLDEVPYDFIRKRLSILVAHDSRRLMITKGALQNVLEVCDQAEADHGQLVRLDTVRTRIQAKFEELSQAGFRTLGLAYRDTGDEATISKESEAAMTFLGFVVLADPPKAGVDATIKQLARLGVALKVITGDNRAVAAHLGQQVGLASARILTGPDIRAMSTAALTHQVSSVNLFAEIEPNQKERIILALKRAGHVVGYMGDGINDASALHAADVGISVDSAVDVAREAADIVLLEHDLGVLLEGVKQGRITFANTLKYVFMATSANFGNMFSMAGASLLLPFLPLLPTQILLANLLTDFPETAIATDNVDPTAVERPRRWDLRFIRNFMLTFGLVSSLFDYLTFGALLLILHASPEEFRAGWFVESVISASLIVLVIRTSGPCYKSMPGRALLIATLVVDALTLALPYSPLAAVLGFSPIPPLFVAMLGAILALYMITAEVAKHFFYRRMRVS